jgi:hypothetical protein
VLATLSRDDTLFNCARANTIISRALGPRREGAKAGFAHHALHAEEIDRINTFGVWRPPSFPLPWQSISLTTAQTRLQRC